MSPIRQCHAKRTVIVALVAIVCVTTVFDFGAFGADQKTAKPRAAKPKPAKIRISKETTYVKGPLRKDGFIDYAAVLNNRGRAGVTPKTNAAVPIAQAFGPDIIDKDMRKRFFDALGIPIPPKKGQYFLSSEAFARKVAGKKYESYLARLEAELQTGIKRSWRKQDSPKLAAWLAANKQPLNAIVEATKRTKWFSPVIVYQGDKPEDMGGLVLMAPLVLSANSWEVAQALAARAMNAVAEGSVDEALRDLLACHRLARLISRGQMTFETIWGHRINSVACRCGVELLRSQRLTAKQLRHYETQLVGLKDFTSIAELTNFADRVMALDSVSFLAKHRFRGFRHLVDVTHTRDPSMSRARSLVSASEPLQYCAYEESDWSPGGLLKKLINKAGEEVFFALVDWNVVLETINAEFDRRYEAAGETPYAARKKALESYWKRFARLRGGLIETDKVIAKTFAGGKINSRVLSKHVGNLIIGLTLEPLDQIRTGEDRALTRVQLLRIAVALERYRKDKGRYPRDLKDLTPKSKRKLSVDLFAEKPFRYRRTNNGYLLYSVGRNIIDNGGRIADDGTLDKDADDDDIAVRMVLKK